MGAGSAVCTCGGAGSGGPVAFLGGAGRLASVGNLQGVGGSYLVSLAEAVPVPVGPSPLGAISSRHPSLMAQPPLPTVPALLGPYSTPCGTFQSWPCQPPSRPSHPQVPGPAKHLLLPFTWIRTHPPGPSFPPGSLPSSPPGAALLICSPSPGKTPGQQEPHCTTRTFRLCPPSYQTP